MRVGQCGLVLFVLAWLSLTLPPVSSITFNAVPDVRKCLREEVHKDVLVVGEYTLSNIAGQRTDITVRFLLLCEMVLRASSK